ncbi:rho GTPase-activating protein 27 isoform X2 [Spea bombifrons]|uniref:rho GTPase-activating protein 27 isoform X2 n=1 Tax=Spea bombifrons TaxID=233779 RepID=UPI0023499E6C|nr:rho GTPase-activating protein 27 isoform X2 [Spea bombifrons]
MQSMRSLEKEFVLVEYEFEYTTKEGRLIRIKPNERYILLKRTNEHWWHVCQDIKAKPFYIPAKYVKVLSSQSLGSNGCQTYRPSSEDVINPVPSTQYSYAFVPPEQHISSAKPLTDGQGVVNNNVLPAIRAQQAGVEDSLRIQSERQVGTSHSPSNTLSHGSMQGISPSNTLSHGSMQGVTPSNTLSPGGTQRVSPNNTLSASSIRTVSPINTLAACTKRSPGPSNPLSAGTLQRISTSNPLLSTCDYRTNTSYASSGVQQNTALSGSSSFLSISGGYEKPATDVQHIEERGDPSRAHVPLRTFHNSKKILDSKKRISFALPPDLQPTIRPTQSLNDLQNIIYELPPDPPLPPKRNVLRHTEKAGLEPASSPVQGFFKAGFENILNGKKMTSGKKSSTKTVNAEEQSMPVYVNLEELQKDNARERLSSQQHSSTSTLDDWETHTDKGTGQPFYYNSVTGETTWDPPFDQAEYQINSPISPTSLSPLPTDEWEKHFDETSKQFYFYNSVTGETSWDPPEEELNIQGMQSVFSYSYGSMDRRPPTPEADYPDYLQEDIDNLPEADYGQAYPNLYDSVPPDIASFGDQISGWSCRTNKDGKKVYTNNYNNDTWLQSQDQHGKTYFYTPDGSSSQWQLPQLGPSGLQRSQSEPDQDNNTLSRLASNFSTYSFPQDTEVFVPKHKRSDSDNNFLLHAGNDQTKSLEKAGVLQKAKIAENGKKFRRKNWSSSWTVLEGGILTFYKDTKNLSSNSLQVLTIPEHTVQLHGATISWAAKDKSSKKHVLELKTLDGSEYLIHHDSETITSDWYKSISNSIGKNTRRSTDNAPDSEAESPRLFGSYEKLGTKDEKDKKFQAGQTSSSTSSDSDRNVRAKLKKFLQRRPTLQSLRDKGYIKDQVFGCHLYVLCDREKKNVPDFVSKSIQAVEKRGLDIDGLYRVSGNLAVIQKLRYKVDHDENFSLDDGRWEDVHVITGALKLFFRELPEPLFPYSHFDKFIEAIKIGDQTQKMKRMKELVQTLPPPNLETMTVLFRHLCSVIEHKESNRMSVQSVAIVFGPTLLRPETEGTNIAMYMVFQNQIVEYLLIQYQQIFNTS